MPEENPYKPFLFTQNNFTTRNFEKYNKRWCPYLPFLLAGVPLLQTHSQELKGTAFFQEEFLRQQVRLLKKIKKSNNKFSCSGKVLRRKPMVSLPNFPHLWPAFKNNSLRSILYTVYPDYQHQWKYSIQTHVFLIVGKILSQNFMILS